MKNKITNNTAFTIYELFVGIMMLCGIALFCFACWAIVHFIAKFW